MRIESRERQAKSREQGPWELCEGAQGLTQSECEKLVQLWVWEDKRTSWLKIDYRIVEDADTEQEELQPLDTELKF